MENTEDFFFIDEMSDVDGDYDGDMDGYESGVSYGVFYTGDYNNDTSILGAKHDGRGLFHLSSNKIDAYKYAEKLNAKYGKTMEPKPFFAKFI
jgi:hypothetical protein